MWRQKTSLRIRYFVMVTYLLEILRVDRMRAQWFTPNMDWRRGNGNLGIMCQERWFKDAMIGC